MANAISPVYVSGIDEVEIELADGTKKTLMEKEILPSGKRSYKGTTLDFDKINRECVKAFDALGEPVPFVLSKEDNTHPKPGEEHRYLEGDLHSVRLGDNGSLYGRFDLSDRAKQIVRNSNGKFGVSARIEVDYTRPDKPEESFPFALSHVCGTTRPHVKGLSPWKAVELSDSEKSAISIDFSSEVEELETPVGDETVTITLSEWQEVQAFIKEQRDAEASLQAALEGSGTPAQTPAVTLSEDAQAQVEAIRAEARQAIELAQASQARAVEKEWNTRKLELSAAGVPPVILDAAEKVLRLARPVTLELSEGETVDATAVINTMLEEMKGIVELSERGSSRAPAEGSEDVDWDAVIKDFS